ncbi:MAG: hypothetical protein ACRDTA_01435 [Pseudonocardiaceae bacterium]
MRPPPTGIIDSNDPWIAGYLKLRHAVLTGELDTREEIAAYAAELRSGLPDPTPPPSIAAFIAADIKITFPLLTDQLWTP